MGEQVYERPFSVELCEPAQVPPANDTGEALDAIWMAAGLALTWALPTGRSVRLSTDEWSSARR